MDRAMGFVVGLNASGRNEVVKRRTEVCMVAKEEGGLSGRKVMVGVVGVTTAAMLILGSGSMSAEAVANPKFPPIDRTNPNRCLVKSSAMGQSNAARDSLFDLRECELSGKDFTGYDISGVIMQDGNFSGVNFTDALMSKAFALGANFEGANFSNVVADRVIFNRSNLKNAIFTNAVLSDSSFDGANLENVDFTDVYIGDFAQKSICKNPTLKGENPTTGAPTKESLGCR